MKENHEIKIKEINIVNKNKKQKHIHERNARTKKISVISDSNIHLNFISEEKLNEKGSNNEETLIEKMLCHLCWEDDLVSERIMFIVNSFLKNNFYLISYPFIENAAFNVAKIFNVNDKYIHKRLETLFELEDDENYTLIKYYIDNKYKNSDATVGGLYIISKIIEKYENAFEYFKKNKNKLEWVKEYYVEFFEGKFKLSFIDKVHPDIFSDIETQIINRLEI